MLIWVGNVRFFALFKRCEVSIDLLFCKVLKPNFRKNFKKYSVSDLKGFEI